MKTYTLSRAIGLWSRAKETRQADPNSIKYLKITLKKYVLPTLDSKVCKLKTKDFEDYLEKFDACRLQNALNIFDQAAKAAMASKSMADGSRRNYRAALSRFLQWMQKETWWQEVLPAPLPKYSSHPTKKKVKLPRFYQREGKSDYGLKLEQLPDSLSLEIRKLKVFRMLGGKSELIIDEKTGEEKIVRLKREKSPEGRRGSTPKMETLNDKTWNNEESFILLFLGWYINEEGHSLEDLSVSCMTEIENLEDYAYWSVEVRGNSHALAEHMVSSAIGIAKWLNYKSVYRKDWSDCDLIKDLQDYHSEIIECYKNDKREVNPKKWKHKEMTHEEARRIANHLKTYCSPHGLQYLNHGYMNSNKRSPAEIFYRWQVYTVYKFLVYCPVRSQEVRGLQLGETLFRQFDSNGEPYYVVETINHKNYKKTKKPRKYRVPDILTKDLDYWIYECLPTAKEAVRSLENWLLFWKLSDERIRNTNKALELAKQGIVSSKVKKSIPDYIRHLEGILSGWNKRVEAYEKVKQNIESLNHIFWMTGKVNRELFGVPFFEDYQNTFYSMVVSASVQASNDLFGPERVLRTNPNALRHIAEKHVRKIKGNAEAFGSFIGHSKKMGDEYAAQITSEYEVNEEMAFGWWIEE